MRRALVTGLAFTVLVIGACSRNADPVATATPQEQPFQFFEEALEGAVLSLEDAGGKWEPDEDDPTASTVLIGGKIGPANIEVATEDATSAFLEKDGTAYLSSSLLLMEDETLARAVMAKHDEGDAKRRWTQERNDGGKAVFKHSGRVTDLPELGDENYTATLDVKITNAEAVSASSKIEYVVFRVRNLLAFVVTQDARASVYARRLESNVVRLTG